MTGQMLDNQCNIPGCGQPVRSRGWCNKHYTRWRKHGDPTTVLLAERLVHDPQTIPDPEDIAWAAGFLEGEGCFQLQKTRRSVYANQVHKPPLERLLTLFGGSLKLQTRKTPQSDIWYWYVYGPRAVNAMTAVQKWMSPRRQLQIKEVLGGR